MTNTSVFLVFFVLALIDGITLILSISKKGLRNIAGTFYLLAALSLALMLFEMTFSAIRNPEIAAYIFNYKVPLVSFIGVSILLLVIRYYRLEKYFPHKLEYLLAIIPFITALMAITSPLHPFLRKELYLVAMEPVRVLHNVRGVWFWVHTAYSYLLTMAAFTILMKRHFKSPAGYRVPSYVLMLAMVIVIFSNLVSMFCPVSIDFTCVGIGIAVPFIYISIVSSSRTDLSEIAREAIYNAMDERLFIANLDREVVDANVAACAWLRELGIQPVFPFLFSRVQQALLQRGATLRENPEIGSTDIYYSTQNRGVVLNLRQRYVYDKSDKALGIYYTLLDITHYKNIIDKLQQAVEIDALTGLANRRAFDELKTRHNSDGTMPMGVILGDANGLKRINDELGHEQGDTLLQLLGMQLRLACPEGGTVARIGGDEFAIVLPGREQPELDKIIENINTALREMEGKHPYSPSIALGAAERTLGDDGKPEPMADVVRRADENMYRNKRYGRRASDR